MTRSYFFMAGSSRRIKPRKSSSLKDVIFFRINIIKPKRREITRHLKENCRLISNMEAFLILAETFFHSVRFNESFTVCEAWGMNSEWAEFKQLARLSSSTQFLFSCYRLNTCTPSVLNHISCLLVAIPCLPSNREYNWAYIYIYSI